MTDGSSDIRIDQIRITPLPTLSNGFVDLPKNTQRMMNEWFITKDKGGSSKDDDIGEGEIVFVEINFCIVKLI